MMPSWRAAVVSSDLKPPVKLLLLVLDMFASEMGCMTYPGKQTLAALTGMTQDQVSKCQSAATKAGFLEYKRGFGASGSEYRYTVPNGLQYPTGVIQGPSDPEPEEMTLDAAKQRNEAERAALGDSLVQAAVEKLGGRIVTIRVAPQQTGFDNPNEENQ